jgi:hypothetical protein
VYTSFKTHLWKKHHDDAPSAVKPKFLVSLPPLTVADGRSTDSSLDLLCCTATSVNESTTAGDPDGLLEPELAEPADIGPDDDGDSLEPDIAESLDDVILDEEDVNVIW